MNKGNLLEEGKAVFWYLLGIGGCVFLICLGASFLYLVKGC